MGVLHGVVENTFGLQFAVPHSFDINGYGLVFSVVIENGLNLFIVYVSALSTYLWTPKFNCFTLTCLSSARYSFKIRYMFD